MIESLFLLGNLLPCGFDKAGSHFLHHGNEELAHIQAWLIRLLLAVQWLVQDWAWGQAEPISVLYSIPSRDIVFSLKEPTTPRAGGGAHSRNPTKNEKTQTNTEMKDGKRKKNKDDKISFEFLNSAMHKGIHPLELPYYELLFAIVVVKVHLKSFCQLHWNECLYFRDGKSVLFIWRLVTGSESLWGNIRFWKICAEELHLL